MRNAVTVPEQEDKRVLYMALELGRREWRLGFTTGMGKRPRERVMAAGDADRLEEEIERSKRRMGLASDTEVVSCYEAGRDGFWIHRFLESIGVRNAVVDASSIEVNRRARRRKTDRLDLKALLRLLIRYRGGERDVWSVVHVPSPEAEDARHLHRELMTLKRERTRITNRIKGLMAGQGVEQELRPGFGAELDQIRRWDGLGLLDGLRARLKREWQRAEWLNQQIREVEKERRALLRSSDDRSVEQVRQLLALRGIGLNSAWLYVMEFFAWRAFENRRQVGALAGLTPTPHQSGDSARELGIEKSGNRHVRWMAIEIAWSWLRFQPDSALTLWYQARFGQGSARMRKIGIVALARKLLIELWHYLETGAVPEGAVLKQT